MYANRLKNGMMWKTKVIAKVGERYIVGRLMAVTEKMEYIIETNKGKAYLLSHDIAELAEIKEEESDEI